MSPPTNNIQKRWALLQTTYRRDDPSYKQHTEEMSPTTNNIQKRWALLQTTYRRDEPYYKQRRAKTTRTSCYTEIVANIREGTKSHI
jgi:hypothetical protein